MLLCISPVSSRGCADCEVWAMVLDAHGLCTRCSFSGLRGGVSAGGQPPPQTQAAQGPPLPLALGGGCLILGVNLSRLWWGRCSDISSNIILVFLSDYFSRLTFTLGDWGKKSRLLFSMSVGLSQSTADLNWTERLPTPTWERILLSEPFKLGWPLVLVLRALALGLTCQTPELCVSPPYNNSFHLYLYLKLTS